MTVKIIAAVARDGTIGDNGEIPWSSAADMQHFKKMTMGHTVIMGRKTWDSIPAKFRPLPGRRNIVLSRDSLFIPVGAEVFNCLEHALASTISENMLGVDQWIIGGAQLYAEALPVADELVITYIYHEFGGDTRFPLDFKLNDEGKENLGWEFVSRTPWENYKSAVEGIDCLTGLDIYKRITPGVNA